jgi:four helix bundle protein
MSGFKQFEDIEAWQMGRALTNAIYDLTRRESFERDRALRHQLRRACVSITSNIAEGFERHSRAEFARFLDMAKGSAGEVRSQLYVALDQEYIDSAEFDAAYALSQRTSRTIAGLSRHLRSAKPT